MSKNLRSMRQAAMAGNHSAARALLKLYGYDEIAAEIKRDRPFSNRVRRAVNVLTAGTGEAGTIGKWEHVEADGSITNDLQSPPPRRGEVLPARIALDD
jgi:hypothetical protein